MYHPSHAYFSTRYRLADVARALIHALGNDLKFSLKSEGQASSTGPLAKEAALAALPTGDNDLAAFWIRKEPPLLEHQAKFILWRDGTVDITFWDWDDEVYEGDREGPDEAQRTEKRLFFFKLHRALVKDAGAILAVLSNYTDKYGGAPHPEELAELVANALKQKPSRGLKLVVKHEDFFWLLAIDKRVFAEPLRAYRKQLEKDFHAVEETPDYLILQRNTRGPIFF